MRYSYARTADSRARPSRRIFSGQRVSARLASPTHVAADRGERERRTIVDGGSGGSSVSGTVAEMIVL
ncbi:unnamed protein product, partial [Iphiclides podalirius]